MRGAVLADAAPRRPTGDTARGGDPPAPAEVAAGGDDHHAPKKSCRDPGDPPDTPRRRRDRLMRAIEAVTTPGETAALCQSVGVSRASLYRRRRPALRPAPPRPRAPRRARWVRPNARRCSTCCTASGSSTSRPPKSSSRSRPTLDVSRARGGQGVLERRAQARHPAYTAPELVATGPNQVGGRGDITKLKGPTANSLYVILAQPLRGGRGWSRATRMRTWRSA